ncbi:MAG: hypothetical protein H8E48_05030 [Chloroflexi bacterium]|nr:hypothetical protein [Chloroflexota bacterium]
MAEQFTVQGKVLEKKETSGESDKGEWTRYSFKIADHNTGRTRTFGWFSEKGAGIRQNKSYEFLCEEKPNKDPEKGPFLNILELVGEIDTPAGSPAAKATGGGDDGFRRSKEELRYTESLKMAVQAVGFQFPQEKTWDDDLVETTRAAMRSWADWFYELLETCEPDPESAPVEPTEEAPAKKKTTNKKADSRGQAADAQAEPAETVPAMSEADLKAVLAEIGMDKEKFEVEVLNTDWATWKSRNGTPLAAYRRLQKWQEEHGGVTA